MPWTDDTISDETGIRAMTVDEILSFNQSNLQVQLVKADLHPEVNRDNVLCFYGVLMQNIKADLESQLQSPLMVLTSIDVDQNDYEGYLSLRNMFCIVNDFLSKIGFTDFIFEDILLPKPLRTRNILSQLIAFLMFCDSRTDKTKRLEEKVLSMVSKRENMSRLEPVLQRKLTDAKADIVKAELRNEQLRQEMKESNEKMEDVLKKRKTVKVLRGERKAEISKLNEEKEKRERDNKALQDRIKQLELQIALPPGELNQAIATRQVDLMKCKTEIQRNWTELALLANKKTMISNWKSRVVKTVDVITNIHQQLELVGTLEEQFKNLKHKGKGLRSQIADLQANLEDRRRQLGSYDEKWDAMEVQHKAKLKAKNALELQIKKNKKWLSRNLNEKDVVKGSLKEEIQLHSAKQARLEKELAELNADHPKDYYDLMKIMDCFHLKLAKYLQEIHDAVESIPLINVDFVL